MMGIGFPELMIILVIIMIIFGAGKLPEIGSAFGNSIKNFKKSMKEAEEIQEAANIEPTEIEADDNNSESLKEETAEDNAEDKTAPQEAEKTTN
jgi:sec-independent protein translocase protein TatA